MVCQEVITIYEQLFSRINRLKSLKDDSIFIKVDDCFIKIESQNRKISIKIAKQDDRKGEILVRFTDLESFKHVMSAENLYDYGERLCYAALDRKVFLDPGDKDKATSSGFFKLLCRNRFKKHIQIFELTIPVI